MSTQWKSIAVVAAMAFFGVRPAHAQTTGPSSSQSPYVTPTGPGWDVTSLLTVGDAPIGSPYRMVGLPDGLGALPGRFDPETGRYRSEHSYMTVFMNHELGATAGVARAHGQTGAFVSQWTVHLDSLMVTAGQDVIQQVYRWNSGVGAYELIDPSSTERRFNRFCSADLPAATAFFNPRTGRGFSGRMFMNGEEAGNEGRAFAHVVSGPYKGRSYDLPYLGRFSWENAVAHPDADNRTIVVGLDDSTPGQVYIYVGDKRSSGNPAERAGLVGGRLYGVKVTDGGVNYGGGAVPLENAGPILDGAFVLADVSAPQADLYSGAALQTRSGLAGVTDFQRPEDGAWDTKDKRTFYFVTTGANGQTSRLYKLRLNSLRNPTGGTIDLVVDSAGLIGTDAQVARSFDNITVSENGRVMVQEDPGNNAYVAKTWEVDPKNPLAAVQILESDRNRFLAGAPYFLTLDEENSGVIEVTDLVEPAWWFERGRRYYLGVTQAHYPIAGELVEGGQLYILESDRRGHNGGDGHEEDR